MGRWFGKRRDPSLALRMMAIMLALMVVLPGSLFAAELPLHQKINKISQVLRGGLNAPDSLLLAAQQNPASIDLPKIATEWLNSSEFYGVMEEWHKQVFRSPHLINSDIEFLDRAPAGLRESLALEPVKLALFILANNFSYAEMLTSRFALRNSILEKFYAGEDPSGAAADDWHLVWREPFESGVLTLRSMHFRNPTTIVNRWRTHANQVLIVWACQELGAANAVADEDDETHGTNAACIGCHRPLDGIGSFFTRWNRPGFHDTSAGIDDRGSFFESLNQTQQADGLKGLGRVLTAGRRFAQCMVDRSWRFLTGRGMTDGETAVRTELVRSFWQSGYSLKSLLKEIVLSGDFLRTE